MNQTTLEPVDLESDGTVRVAIPVGEPHYIARPDGGLATSALTLESLIAELEELAFGLLQTNDVATGGGLAFTAQAQAVAGDLVAVDAAKPCSEPMDSGDGATPCVTPLFAGGVAPSGKRSTATRRARAARRSDEVDGRSVHQFALPLAGEGGMPLAGSSSDERSNMLRDSGNQFYAATGVAGRR